MNRVLVPLALIVTLSACESDTKSAGAIAGHWSQETGSDSKGMTLEFDAQSDKLLVHTAPDADGGHDHLSGSYTADAASGAVTVRCELNGKGKGDTWNGKLDGDRFTLTAGTTTLRFRRGKDPHK